MKSSQQGFTLIELVVVMVILGVLAATALPKFMDVNTRAHYSAVAGTAGGFGAAVGMAHAQYVANGSIGAVTGIAGFGAGDVATDTNGWPTATSAAECNTLWGELMQNPPTVNTATGSAYQTTFNAAAGGNPANCTYTYQDDTTRILRYDLASSGAMTVTNVEP